MACHNIVNKASCSAGALMLASAAMTSAVAAMIVRQNWAQEQEEVSRHQLLSWTQFPSSTKLESLVCKPMDVMSSGDEMIQSLLSAQQLTNYKRQSSAVVFSACSSSEGVLVGEEGILARALLVSGAPAVSLSLWTTQDVETRELMTRLYKNLITGRHPNTGRPNNLALALRQAILRQERHSSEGLGSFSNL